jgi:hypothetical protein
MDTMKKMIINNEKGFALLAAIIASLILMAVGVLVINMSTGDLRASSVTVGDKKVLAATESGIHRLIQDFNPDPATWTAANNYTSTGSCGSAYIWRAISSGASAGIDDNTQFAICQPAPDTDSSGNALQRMTLPGDLLGCGGAGTCPEVILVRYCARVAGISTSYNLIKQVSIGIGYRTAE